MNSLFTKILFKLKVLLSNEYSLPGVYRSMLGVKIGKNVRFTGRPNVGSEPYLVEIGNNVTITQDVTFHTHDGGVGVFRAEYPGINIFGKIVVGDNVFIGSGVTIMPGVRIGSNVVVGAGSIVTKDIPSNVVVVGIPAKVVQTIDEYKAKVLSKAVFITESDPVKRKKNILEYVAQNARQSDADSSEYGRV